MAAVEVDFGGGLFERIEIAMKDDPVAVARDFCQAKGFSATIAVPLAVKLEQAKDKSRRIARAAKQGRPVTTKKEMTSTLTAKGKAEAKARLEQLHSGVMPRSASAQTRPPKLVYEKSKQFHSSAEHVFDRTEVVFGQRRPTSAQVSSRRVAGEISTRSLVSTQASHKRFVFGAGPGKQSREKPKADQLAAKKEEQRREREAKDREARLRGITPATREDSQVFDKLYGNAMRKKEKAEQLAVLKEAAQKAADAEARSRSTKVMSRVSRELMQNRTAGEYSSYNERLYAEGAQRAEQREAARQRAAEEKEREEMEHATGAPAISRYAKSLRRPDAAWDRLGEGYAEKFAVLAQIKEDLERKELSECTFRPKINSKSKNLMRGKTDALRDRGLSHHEQLYFDANRRQMRVEEYEAWRPSDHTFHPNAHRHARDDLYDTFKAPKVHHDEVVRRLEASKVRSEHEKKRLEEDIYADLGKPSVGRPPAIDRNPAGLPVYEVLYANRHEYDDKRELIRARDEDRLREVALSAKSSAKSDGLVGALKRRKFRKMFAALDSDATGRVDLKTADLSRLADVDAKHRSFKGEADSEFGSVYNTPASGAVSVAATPTSAARPDLGGFGGVPDGSPGSPGVVVPDGSVPDGSPKLREMIHDVRSAASKCDGPVGMEGFIAAMEEVIKHDRYGPRAYLAPGQGRFSGARAGTKAAQAAAAARERADVEEELGKNSTSTTRTERLAQARQRKLGVSSNTPIYEKLAVEGRLKDEKLRTLAAEMERAKLAECTFTPQTHAHSDFSVYEGGGGHKNDRNSVSRTGSGVPGVQKGKHNNSAGLQALENLAASAPAPVGGAEKFAALEKELEALASRAGLGNQLPMAALQAEESSEDEDEV